MKDKLFYHGNEIEVTSFNLANYIEKVHIDLRVKKCTPSYMIYNELGRLPLNITRKIRKTKYWLKLLKYDNCVLNSLYVDMFYCPRKNNWLCKIKCLLSSLVFADDWQKQYCN